ncbi:uncharacterized protein B0I36DRAFT_110576 [Microdochium trichocladiopsis]|uniref:Uncharacterized protein n=1 Tax=Microdochium trichocladiopsis TaxID=1682393 RepID=A0A9P8Y9I0_9PEZI|nr:uncharacterized protein B0I36DRAFT_110576 [Microdochium trichocladiopsis]KAH7033572.1 hypothetical protein B0I36DRAFT_110576 [Microdochium trichocladiopsis]
MSSHGTFGPRPLTGRTSSSLMTGGLGGPAPAKRGYDVPSNAPIPHNHARPGGPRSFTGPIGFSRPPVGRSFTSTLSVPQPSKLSTVQYAEDVRLPDQMPDNFTTRSSGHSTPSASLPPFRPPKTSAEAAPVPVEAATMTPAIRVSPASPEGPWPYPTSEATPRAQSPPERMLETLPVPMPGCLPSPYWVMRKAQHAQRSKTPLASSNEHAASQLRCQAKTVPAPYFEDVPDEGEPSRQ